MTVRKKLRAGQSHTRPEYCMSDSDWLQPEIISEETCGVENFGTLAPKPLEVYAKWINWNQNPIDYWLVVPWLRQNNIREVKCLNVNLYTCVAPQTSSWTLRLNLCRQYKCRWENLRESATSEMTPSFMKRNCSPTAAWQPPALQDFKLSFKFGCKQVFVFVYNDLICRGKVGAIRNQHP